MQVNPIHLLDRVATSKELLAMAMLWGGEVADLDLFCNNYAGPEFRTEVDRVRLQMIEARAAAFQIGNHHLALSFQNIIARLDAVSPRS